MFSESCGNRLGCSYILLADNLKFQRTILKSDPIVRWTTSFLTLISNAAAGRFVLPVTLISLLRLTVSPTGDKTIVIYYTCDVENLFKSL